MLIVCAIKHGIAYIMNHIPYLYDGAVHELCNMYTKGRSISNVKITDTCNSRITCHNSLQYHIKLCPQYDCIG